MKVTVTKAHRRQINQIAKRHRMELQWHKRKPTDYIETFEVLDESSAFYDLQCFVRDMSKLKEKIGAIVCMDMGEVEKEIIRRKAEFDKHYGIMFESLKENNKRALAHLG